jgi:hypothetical protein
MRVIPFRGGLCHRGESLYVRSSSGAILLLGWPTQWSTLPQTGFDALPDSFSEWESSTEVPPRNLVTNQVPQRKGESSFSPLPHVDSRLRSTPRGIL